MKKICTGLIVSIMGVSPLMAEEKPNIILFLVDDMGWSDLGCYAQDDFNETPNIDKMATDGILFTDGYAACSVSSPTRASILTGQYPARLHLTDWIPGHATGNEQVICPKIYYELPTDRITIAQALKKQGYKTLHIGKWHLGEEEQFWPEHYGFDVNIGGHSKGAPGSYHFPYAKIDPLIDWTVLNLPEDVQDGDYLTDVLTNHALSEIDQAVKEENPFFLNMSYYQVHVPMEGKPEYVEKYRSKLANGNYKGVKNLEYAAMIQSLDESVGRILGKLNELGIEKETFIILTSDNGGLVGKDYNGNAPLKGGKGTNYEGGIREPFIIRWPGKIEKGKVSDQVVVSTDIYSTILDVAGTSPFGNTITDGISLLPYILGEKTTINRDAVYWHYPHFHAGPPTSVIRKDNYKLIEFLVSGKVELYNLKEDIGETTDLAVSMPDKVRELKEQLHKWKKEVDADELVKRTNDTEKIARKGNGWQGANNIKNPPFFEMQADRQVQIKTFNEGEIRYTLDGSDPIRSSRLYREPIDMKKGGEVKAKVWSIYKGQSFVSETCTFRVPLDNVTLVSVTSGDKNYPSSHIFDKKAGTYWQSNNQKLPESVIVDFGKTQSLRSFIYYPARRERMGEITYRTMPNNRQGAIEHYRFEIGDDLDLMHEVKDGFFNYGKYAFLDGQVVCFDVPVTGRYVRFTALSSVDNGSVINIENIEFIPEH